MHSSGHLLVRTDRNFDDVAFTYRDKSGQQQVFYKSVVQNIDWDVSVTGFAESDMPSLGIKTGDEVIFSYLVISEKVYVDSPDTFRKVQEIPGVTTEWRNDAGLMLRKFKGPFPGMWDAMAMSLKGELIGTSHGTEDQVDRFLSQFSFSNSKGRFKNLFEVNGKDLWKVKKGFIMGVRRGESVELFNNQVLALPLYVDMTTRVNLEQGLRLPDRYVQAEYDNMAKVVSGGKELGLKEGDFVVFEKKYVQKYKFWGKDYYVIPDRRVFGVFDDENKLNLVVNS